MEEKIGNVILSMREFQKLNCITGQCISNAKYLYDCIKTNTTWDVKIKAIMIISNNSDADVSTCVVGHLVIFLNDGDDDFMIDPSYETYSLKNKCYFDNIKDILNSCCGNNNSQNMIRENIPKHIHFIKLAEQMNKGICLIANKKIYNQQADYVEKNIAINNFT